MESVQRYELPNYSQLLWWGRKSLAARQHPTHPQGTVICHLSCSKASVDPAGEHHNLYLRFSAPPGPAGRVSIHYGSALLVINSCCAAKMQGEPAEVLGRMVDDPLCYNWLSRNEHHPMGYKSCTGNLGDRGSQNDWDPKGFKVQIDLIEGCGHLFWRDMIAQHFFTWNLPSSCSLQDKLNLALLSARSLKSCWGLVLCFLQLL